MEDNPRLSPDNGEVSGLEHQDGELSQSSSTSSTDKLYVFHDNEETVDDLNSSVQDLVSRYRGGPSPQPKKRDRALSPTTDSHDSPKRRSLTEGSAEAGKYLVRAAPTGHDNLLSTLHGLDEGAEDEETDDLMAMIRQTQTSSTEDIDQSQPNESEPMPAVRRRSRQGSHPGGLLISQVTAELVKKFESGKEPEEKKPRSSEPLLVKIGALHDPDDLDSSHVDLQDDLDPKLSMASAEGHVSLHDDLENDIEENVDVDHKQNNDLAENFDLDSSGSVDQLNMMKSETFPEEANMLSNTMSLADELQQANAAESSDSDSVSSGDQGQYNIAEYSDQNEETRDEKRYSGISNESQNEQQNEENEDEVQAKSSDGSSPESDSDSVEEYDVTAVEPDVSTASNDISTSELTSSEMEEAKPILTQSSSEVAEEAKEEPAPDEEKPAEVAIAPVAEDQADQESSLDGTDLDFSVLQSSQPLNVDVTKQRITLRQKGSLAKRRKPTRSSVRSLTNTESTLFTDSTEPRQAASPEEEEDDRVEEMSPRERLTVREQQVTRSSSMPADRRSTQPRPAPVLLPGLGDHIKRRTRAPVPLPKPTELSKPASESSPPPWMAEVRVRRGSRPVKADLERAPSEPRNPESPSWMRDALSKKKRAAELLEQRNTQHVETEQPTVPPWMKELRRTPRQIIPPPLSNNNDHTSSSEATPTPREKPAHVTNHNNVNASRQEPFQSPFESRSKGREVLAPLKRSSVDNSTQPSVIDNRLATPPYLGTSNGQVSEILPNKNVLPPLKPTSQSSTSQDNQENSESPMPAWRKEIAARRKSKTFVPAVKPETPLKLGEMPAWKRELAERNKIKKRDSIDMQSNPSPTPPSSVTSSPSLLPWQQELAQRRKRTPSITRQPTIESPSNQDSAPSWAKNVERRRARLADSESSDCGLIDKAINEKSG